MNKSTWHESMLADLLVAGMSKRTQEAYLRAVRQLQDYYNGTDPKQLSEQHVKDYLLWLRTEKRAAPGTLRISIGGLRFFFRHTAVRDWKVLDKFRIPTEKKLPEVLTVLEVRRIMHAIRLPRFYAYFWTVYSCGLRLNEALALQVGDIDAERMRIHVRRGKGAKDRFVPLPHATLQTKVNKGAFYFINKYNVPVQVFSSARGALGMLHPPQNVLQSVRLTMNIVKRT